MNYRPIILVAGEPNSIFFEILFKVYKKIKIKSPLILIASQKLLYLQMKKLNFKKKIKVINQKKIKDYKLNNDSINLINVDYDQKKAFEKISNKSNEYIKKCFDIAILLIKSDFSNKLINGPISKKNFLKKKFMGITEFFAKEFDQQKIAMLIYNKELSVCPITTHLPIKNVASKITEKLIWEKIILIDNFYRKYIRLKPKIAITGLNPHCESINKINEDEKIIKPTVKKLSKKGYKVSGPFSADTIFLKKNRKKFDVIVGMYHDQVLTPIKTIFEYDAINITLGLPFIRISPDHGPNEQMVGKNLSDPLSLIKAITFFEKIK
jgi:4-hydroxythreonine-4-phosphate dehydrogenase